MVIQLNILNERAMEVIRYLEKVKDIELIEPIQRTDEPTQQPRRTWAGAIENPSKELLDYADNVRKEWNHRI